MRKLALTLTLALIAVLATPAASARVRAVHHPGESCSYQIVPTWGATIPSAGVTRAMVLMYGQTSACSQWMAYSSVDWVTVEAAPDDTQPAAYVTVAPNPVQQARSTTLLIAGLRLELTQDAAATVTPPNPNLLANGSFNTDIASWVWQSPRFPNGNGTAQWSALDANGSPASGSILLTDTGKKEALQRLQIIPVLPRTQYRFSTKVRPGGPPGQGSGVIAIFDCPDSDCSGEYRPIEPNHDFFIDSTSPGTWEPFSVTFRTRSSARGLLIVIASSAITGDFETWFDDVELLPAQ